MDKKTKKDQVLAYHVVVRALEGRAGFDPVRRLWLSLRHVVDGHLPYERYRAAGFARAAERASISEVERWVLDWLSTDLNPAGQIGRVTRSARALVEGYNAYNNRACLGVRTTMSVSAAAGQRRFEVKRDLLSTRVDPEPCKVGTLTVFDALLGQAADGSDGQREPLRASQVARILGVSSSATAQAAEVFEEEGALEVPALAKRLGCGARSLERKVREEGGTPEQIKIACRLVKAQGLLGGGMSLTQIALEAGFSDSAHMSRAYKASCGMSPSEMRLAILGSRRDVALSDGAGQRA